MNEKARTHSGCCPRSVGSNNLLCPTNLYHKSTHLQYALPFTIKLSETSTPLYLVRADQMAAISPLQKFLLALHRLLAAVFNLKHLPRALAAILHRLLIWCTTFRSNWRISQKNRALPITPTFGPPKIDLNEPNAVGSVQDQEKGKESGGSNANPPQVWSEHISSSRPCKILENGESVSLDNVACSLHPYSNIPKGTFPLSLQLTKASLHLAVPQSQFSTSLPDHQIHSPISISRALASPSIGVVSPNDGPTSITYTQSESPMPFPHLENWHIWPAMPEYSTRYFDRPIM